MEKLFYLNASETEKIVSNDGKIVSYTDNGITLTAGGTSNVTIEDGGFRMGSGDFNDSGAWLKGDIWNTIPFNYAFMVVKENRLGKTMYYNKALLATHQEDTTNAGFANGLLLAMNYSLNICSTLRNSSKFLAHTLKIGQNSKRAAQPIVPFSPAGDYKVIMVELPVPNTGNKLVLGAVNTNNVNTTTYSQVTIKELLLANCTQEEANDYFNQLLNP